MSLMYGCHLSNIVFGCHLCRDISLLLQLLMGAPEDRLTQMRLTRDPTRYHFVSQGGDAKVRNIQ